MTGASFLFLLRCSPLQFIAFGRLRLRKQIGGDDLAFVKLNSASFIVENRILSDMHLALRTAEGTDYLFIGIAHGDLGSKRYARHQGEKQRGAKYKSEACVHDASLVPLG